MVNDKPILGNYLL